MLSSDFVEDTFIKFYDLVMLDEVPLQAQDLSAASSFYSVILQGKELTQNQANFILKLLAKYRVLMLKSSFDYQHVLDNPQWKTPFRILDLSKKIFVEKESNGSIWVCVKFPYQLKREFDDEFEDKQHLMSSWDPERKLRQLSVYDANLVQLYEFALKHNFEIDDTFMIALAEVEEIWQNQEEVLPFSSVVANWVVLGNSSTETDDWFKSHSSGLIENDLLLAKSMGYHYSSKPHTMIEKIAASDSNSFWIKNNADFLSLCNSITGRVCIVLDRTSNTLDWLTQFITDADAAGIDRNEIKVCFRDSKEQNTGINEWIKANGVGGKVETGRILIFEFKPAKWLFKEQESVKLLVSNNLYPSTNQLTKDWVSSHPCVIYLGDIKPSEQRGQKIVEL
jgi:hypothetical protein